MRSMLYNARREDGGTSCMSEMQKAAIISLPLTGKRNSDRSSGAACAPSFTRGPCVDSDNDRAENLAAALTNISSDVIQRLLLQCV